MMRRSNIESPGLAELIPAAEHTLDLCNARESEKVVIYHDTRQEPKLVEAFFIACVAKGCDVSVVKAPYQKSGTPSRVAVAAMKEADLILEMASESFFYSDVQSEILNTGSRLLTFFDIPLDAIVSRPPSIKVYERAQRAGDLVAEGQKFRITSPEGTDFSVARGNMSVIVQKGYVSEPGEIDYYACSTVAFYTLEGEGEGIFYVNGPMLLLPEPIYYIVKEPFSIEVRDGAIVSVDDNKEGGKIFKRWYEELGDANIGKLSHFGFGSDYRAGLEERVNPSAWESIDGNIGLGFGSNVHPEGGDMLALGHCDFQILGASFFIDGKPIISDGKFTEESGLNYKG